MYVKPVANGLHTSTLWRNINASHTSNSQVKSINLKGFLIMKIRKQIYLDKNYIGNIEYHEKMTFHSVIIEHLNDDDESSIESSGIQSIDSSIIHEKSQP